MIYQKGVRASDALPEDLADEIRMALGLREYASLTDEEICLVAGIPLSRYVTVVRVMETYGAPHALKQVARFGLPLNAAVKVPIKFSCVICNNQINVVPCPKCWMKLNPGVEFEQQDASEVVNEPDPPPPVFATDAAPGTREKVDVLKMRVENNEGLWHPDDNLEDSLAEDS